MIFSGKILSKRKAEIVKTKNVQTVYLWVKGVRKKFRVKKYRVTKEGFVAVNLVEVGRDSQTTKPRGPK